MRYLHILLLALCGFSAGFLEAKEPRNYHPSSVNEVYLVNPEGTRFRVSDGSVWDVVDEKDIKHWNSGDKIVLKLQESSFLLFWSSTQLRFLNLDLQEEIEVELFQFGPVKENLSLSIVDLDVAPPDDGPFAKNDRFVRLSDGSLWRVWTDYYTFSAEEIRWLQFDEGDDVIFGYSPVAESYFMIPYQSYSLESSWMWTEPVDE